MPDRLWYLSDADPVLILNEYVTNDRSRVILIVNNNNKRGK